MVGVTRSGSGQMLTFDEILQSLPRLGPDQRERVRAELDRLEQEQGGLPTSQYADLLELAGFASSEFTDVSSNKNKYLADAYATKK
jgi:hypothetical protein